MVAKFLDLTLVDSETMHLNEILQQRFWLVDLSTKTIELHSAYCIKHVYWGFGTIVRKPLFVIIT